MLGKDLLSHNKELGGFTYVPLISALADGTIFLPM